MSLLGKPRPKLSKKDLPLLALRDVLIFPQMVAPFFAGRGSSIKSLEIALSEGQEIFLVPQKTDEEEPKQSDLHPIGIVAYILQTLKLPDGTVRVLVEGRERAKLLKFNQRPDYVRAEVEPLAQNLDVRNDTLALMQVVLAAFKDFKEVIAKLSKDKVSSIFEADTPDKLVDLILPHLNVTDDRKLEFFLEEKAQVRLENLAVTLEVEKELNTISSDIHKKVKARLDQNQKEYYLNEQIKEINKELGYDDGDPTGAGELRKKIEALELPADIKEKALKECGRLAKLQGTTPEAGILRTYLEWITELPWTNRTVDSHGLANARTILDADHFDMQKAKERILDFIAVRQIQDKLKGPILCLVGPPGTGKTSLGRSVARALGRSFVRISLGGVRDEAEIRGHRKTYVGALPGKIIQSMKKAGSVNPVFLLDEIDKMSSDFRGDPAAALLEVLDPEQNATFVDHYLEVPYNLSDVMFITTANSLHNLPRPLLDRMEVIEIPGYTDLEKQKIAESFIVPKQRAENGFGDIQVTFEAGAIQDIIHNYTSESGVRSLERQIGSVLRKLARRMLEDGFDPLSWNKAEDRAALVPTLPEAYKPGDDGQIRLTVKREEIRGLLGLPLLKEEKLLFAPKAGIAMGLAWTEVGGKVLPVEVSLFKGKGELILTGSLGDVMKESVRIALSFVKSHAQHWGLKDTDFKDRDLHIHFPEGAIPKDGPSAGITEVAAIVSALRDIPLKSGIAMTGEVTLTGRVLAIGGVKEKVLAAYRNGFKQVFLPLDNQRNLEEIPDEVKAEVTFHHADTILEAVALLFPENTFSAKV